MKQNGCEICDGIEGDVALWISFRSSFCSKIARFPGVSSFSTAYFKLAVNYKYLACDWPKDPDKLTLRHAQRYYTLTGLALGQLSDGSERGFILHGANHTDSNCNSGASSCA